MLTKKARADRVLTSEIAEHIGVSAETVRRMHGEFALLYKIHEKTETNRVYWLREDYENGWRKRLSQSRRKPPKRSSVLIKKAAPANRKPPKT